MDTGSVHFSKFKEQIVNGKKAMQKIWYLLSEAK